MRRRLDDRRRDEIMKKPLRNAALEACLAAAAVLLLTLLPFLPGSHDPLAVPVAVMSMTFGLVGLLMVPFGALAIVAHARGAGPRTQRMLERATLGCAVVVWMAVTLSATASAGFILGAVTLGAGGFALWRARRPAAGGAAPLHLALVPLPVALVQLTMVGYAVEFSRGRAIGNSAAMIADVERYREANGRYPSGLASQVQDYRPDVIGIREYRYEASGDAYNLYFEQFTTRLGTREIVVYNPRDDQTMASHDMDILRPRPGQASRPGGYYSVRDAAQPHWKYFWFD
jgi:hypothetical protein